MNDRYEIVPNASRQLRSHITRPVQNRPHEAFRRLHMEPLETRRLLATWGIDSSFGDEGMVTTEFYDDTSSSDAAYALAIQADGKIIAAGSAGAFTRYNTDGSVDLSFGDAGHVDFTSIARDIAVQDDGKILVAGTGFGLKRYNSDGSLDATFGDGGTVHFSVGKGTAIGYSLAIQDDGRIVVAGTWTKSNDSALMIVRYNVDGTLDNTFDSDGILTFAFEGDETDVTSVALQDDGKIVVAGCVGESLDQDFLVVRCNSDGSMDNTFGDLGIVRTDFEGERDLANSVAIQSDGKIVLAGWAYSDFKGHSALARYNIDGALDTTFDTDGKAITDLLPLTTDDCAYGMVIQPDGKIALAGKSSDDFAVVRYNSDGTLDSSFGNNGQVVTELGIGYESAQAIVLQSDGQIVVAGYAKHKTTHEEDFALARYNTDGSLDVTFGGDGIVTTNLGVSKDYAKNLAIQDDGKIILAGSTFNGDDTDFALTRYLSDGSLDTTFDGDGRLTTDFGGTHDYVRSIGIQSDGKIIVAGSSNNDFALARYNSDGTLDTSFDDDGLLVTDFNGRSDSATTVLLQSDGNILVGGQSSKSNDYDYAMARYSIDGILDESFGVNGLVTTDLGTFFDHVYSMAMQDDGRIILAGDCYGEIAVVRYHTDGSLDPSFDGDGVVTLAVGTKTACAHAVAIQDDGKIVVVGSSWTSSNREYFTVVRLNNEGPLDSSFDDDGIVTTDFGDGSNVAYGVTILEDGDIFVVGTAKDGTVSDFALACYNSDGSPSAKLGDDGTLTTWFFGTSDYAYEAALQDDGKIVVAGYAETVNDSDFAIARYALFNDAPVANADSVTVCENGAARIDVLVNDLAGTNAEPEQALAVTSASALHGTVTIGADGTLTYVPKADFYGEDTITYTVTDDGTTHGVADPRTATGVVSVTVTGLDDAPVALCDTAYLVEGSWVEVDVLANDSDADNLSPLAANAGLFVSAVTQAGHGTVTFTTAGVTYSPEVGFNGWDSFSYTIEDASGLSSTSTVSVTVVAPTPTAGGPYTLVEGEDLVLAATGSASQEATYRWDLDGDGDFDENITGPAVTVPWSVLEGLGLDGPTTRTIAVEVSTPTGTGTATTSLEVTNAAPVAVAFDENKLWRHAGGEAAVAGVVADSSSLDVLSGTVDWGDGTSEALTLVVTDGQAAFDAAHSFAADGQYTITVTVADDDGGSLVLTRQVVVGSVSWQDGVLDILGTAENDTLTLGIDGENLALSASFLEEVPVIALADIQTITVSLLDGNDTLVTDPAITVPITVDGGAGDDGLQTGAGEDWLYGGDGNDTLSGGAGLDRIYGQMGDDRLSGGADRDLMSGQGGNDWLDGEDGHDLLYGNGGNDFVFGHAGKDRLFGHEGDDMLVGGDGNDRLSGSLGQDVLLAGQGADWVMGHADSDLIAGGATAYDDTPDALDALMAAWLAEDASLSDRIKTIAQGFGSDAMYALSATDTVLADAAQDDLAGNGGADWYLADAADLIATGGGDHLTRG